MEIFIRRIGLLAATIAAFVPSFAIADQFEPKNLEFAYRDLMAADIVAQECQPPVDIAAAAFQKNSRTIRERYLAQLSEQSPALTDDAKLTLIGARQALVTKEIDALIKESGCGSDRVRELLGLYDYHVAWKPEREDYRPPLSQRAQKKLAIGELEKIYLAAGYRKSGAGWLNECRRPAELELVEIDLNKDGSIDAILTSVDAVCFGRTSIRNTVLMKDSKAGWRAKLTVLGALHVLNSMHRGFNDLTVGGPGRCGDELYGWDGKSYSFSCTIAPDPDTHNFCAKEWKMTKFCH